MNSVLSYIAGLLVLLLFAALVGPSVVDWNSFRHEIEAQVSGAIGRPVSIDGDIRFVILPAPRFSLQGLSISSLRGGDPLAEFGTLEGEVALTPLLRGEVTVTRIRALDFTVRVMRDEEGGFNWIDEEGVVSAAMLDLKTVSLEVAHFEHGSVIYQDAAANHEFVLENVSGDLKATSLLGPLRFDGVFELAEQPYEVSASVGIFGGDRAFPVNIELQAPMSDWRVSFTGLATDASADARLDGTVEAQFGISAGLSDEEAVPVLSLQAGAVINRSITTLRDVELVAAGSSLKGQIVLAYDTEPAFTAEFTGARLLLDKLLRDLEQMRTPIANMRFPLQLTGTVDVQVADVTFADLYAENVTGRLVLDQGKLNVTSLLADLPGETKAEATGTIIFVEGEPRFDGSLDATIADFGEFSRWLETVYASGVSRESALGESVLFGNTGGLDVSGKTTRLVLRTDIALQPALWQAYSLSAVFSDGTTELAPMTGGVSFARRGRPALGIELNGPLLDLNFLAPFLAPVTLNTLADFSEFDANIVLSVDLFRFRDWSLGNLRLAAVLADDRLSIEQFEAVSNAIDGETVGHLSVSGGLENIGLYPSGGLEGRVSTSLLVDWARGLGMPFAPVHDGELSFVVRGEHADERHLLALDMSGRVGGSNASLVFKQTRNMVDEQLLHTDFRLALDNADASALLQQVGLGEGLDGGALLVQLSGAGEGPFDTNVRLRAGETIFSATGKTGATSGDDSAWFVSPQFSGRFEVSADRFGSVAAVAGWRGPLVDMIAANGRGGAVIAGGAIDWTRERLAISGLEAVAGTFRVSGLGSYLSAQVPAKINATIELGHISLDPLLQTQDGGAWDVSPLAWQGLADMEGRIAVKGASVGVAGLIFTQVEANALLSDGVLSFTPVTAQFAGGRLTMGGRFVGGSGVPGLGMTVALEDAEISKASKMIFGELLGEGTVTASLQLEGRGRSLLGLVSTLSGRGTFTLGEGSLSGFDLPAFRAGLGTLGDMDGFEALVAQTLGEGVTAFSGIEGAVQVEDGVLRFTPTVSEVTGTTQVQINGLVDFVRFEMDVESAFSLAGIPPLPPLTMVLGGSLRELDRRTDTLALQAAIARSLLVREMEGAGIEELPEELRELIEPHAPGDSLDAPPEGVDARRGEEGTPVPARRPLH